MSLNIKATSVEEAEHPYYVVRYIVEDNGEELLNSVARYVAQPNGAKVQFLEPDMRKLLKLGLNDKVDQPLQEIVDKVVRDKATTYIKENQEK